MPPAHAERAAFPPTGPSAPALRRPPRQAAHLHAPTECGPRTKRWAFLEALPLRRFPREPGTAVFVGCGSEIDADGFVRVLASRGRMPQRVLLVATVVELVASVPAARRVELTPLGNGIDLATLRYGFNDEPDIPRALAAIGGLELDDATTRYYVADDKATRATMRKMPAWQRWLFALMCTACVPAADYFGLPVRSTTQLRARDR